MLLPIATDLSLILFVPIGSQQFVCEKALPVLAGKSTALEKVDEIRKR